MTGFLPIYSERLVLRDFAANDWQAVQRYAGDPEVVRYMDWGPNDEATTRGFIGYTQEQQRQRPRHSFDLAVTLANSGELIGGCSLSLVDAHARAGEIGYCFRRDAWGHGYATEAARALLHFGFRRLALHRIAATCAPDNHASAAVLGRIGMRREGLLRDHKRQGNVWRDSLLFAVLEDDQPPRASDDVANG